MEHLIYDGKSSCFYLGSTYVYQGGVYPSLGFKDEAKRYKSKKRAENAVTSLKRKCEGDFDVVQADE